MKRCLLKSGLPTGARVDWTSFADDASTISAYCRLYRHARVVGSHIGNYTYISEHSVVSWSDVGKFCSIGPRCLVGGLGRHPTKWISTHPLFYSTRRQVELSFVSSNLFDELPRTTIGNDVWLGARSIVLDGVNVGDGAIVAAGAVVSRDVEPYAIVGGVPAKLIRHRFPADARSALTTLRWWDEDGSTLEMVADRFTEKSEWTASDIKSLGDALLAARSRAANSDAAVLRGASDI